MLKKLISISAMTLALVGVALLGLTSSRADDVDRGNDKGVYATVPDFSGMQWVDGDKFLAVHDVKNPKSAEAFPRMSFVWLPKDSSGIVRKGLNMEWPAPQGPASDLESISRIPGTDKYLLVESGSSSAGKIPFKRVFLVEIVEERISLIGFTELPDVVNVEGTAVAQVADGYIFLWAERADNQKRTTIWQAPLKLTPLALGKAKGTVYKPAGFTGKSWRPVSALEIDSKGVVYAASAYDTDNDSGPFNSVVWRIGKIDLKSKSSKSLELDSKPELIARVDGVKIESLSVVEKSGSYEMFYGFDDEDFGGGLRKLLLKN